MMMKSVVQVIPQDNYTVVVYFDDGKIKLYDMSPLVGNFDPYNCLDIDPLQIYEAGKDVKDPLIQSA